MAIVYQATNLQNGKRYIGVTAKTLEIRRSQHHHTARKGHKKIFSKALRKYGEEAFCWEVLHDYLFSEHAVEAEVRFIAERKPEYNMTLGGDGTKGLKASEETRAKLRAAHTPERRALMGAKLRGRKCTPEQIARMVAAHAGITQPKLRGIPRPQHVRDIARATGIKYKDQFIERMKHITRWNVRAVRCLDDGMEFKSASEAARNYGVSKSAVIEMCLGTSPSRHVGGHRFEYVGQKPKEWTGKRREKLTLADVHEIRTLFGTMSHSEIAKRYGVHRITIHDIFSGRNWKGK